MAQPSILLTGFGPFPGVPLNPSAWLAEALASEALASSARAHLDYTLHAEVLPTEWTAVSLRAPRLFHTLSPRLSLHFGLSQRARDFRIERFAHNRVTARADAAGALPSSSTVLPDGDDRVASPLPASSLATHLRKQGLAATPSRSAGGYLCNFLYYLSLDWTARQQPPCHAMFVHIPAEKVEGGPFDRAELLRGASAILRFAIAFAEAGDKTAPVGAAPAAERKAS
jgi:pyroglutamyl-peptidase